MRRKISQISGYTLLASDGEIGRCQDFLFDDRTSSIRYMVAKTAKWLPGRKVVIAPTFLEQPDHNKKQFPLRLTREQIEKSPPLDEHAPVSREYELNFHEYYALPIYWAGPAPWGVYPDIEETSRTAAEPDSDTDDEEQPEEGHLRSTNEVIGYHIRAKDGEIGHVEDFLVDDKTWTLRYLVIDTGNWLPGRKVLVSMNWLESVSWANRSISVDMTRDSIENSPEYEPSKPVEREDEISLHKYYGYPYFWE